MSHFISHFNSAELFHGSLNLHFPMTNDADHLLMGLFSVYIFSLVISVHVISPLFKLDCSPTAV